MRKHSSIIILILSALMIVGGYFVYMEFIYPIYLNNLSQEKRILLNKEQELELIKRPEQSSIYGIEIEISPNEGANYAITIEERDEINYDVRVKQGTEFVYKTDWYSDTCYLKFTPQGPVKDSITVSYRFLGLND